MERLSVVGKRLPRIDSVIKATGQARYTSDIPMSGIILYGKILRSPFPHAKILNIDTSKAERLKGVKAIIKGKDTLGIKYGAIPGIPSTMDEQALPIDKLESEGELKRIKVEVDWNRELGAVARKAASRNGPALLFENIKDFIVGFVLATGAIPFARAYEGKTK